MFNKFKNMTIKRKLFTSFTTSVVMFGVLTLFAMLMLDMSSTKYRETYTDYGLVTAEVAYSLSLHQEAASTIYSTVLAVGTQYVEEAAEECSAAVAELYAVFDDLETKLKDDNTIKQLATVRKQYEDIREYGKTILAYATSGQETLARNMFFTSEFHDSLTTLEESFHKLYDYVAAAGDDRIQKVQLNQRVSMIIIVVVAALCIAFIVMVSRILGGSISNPVANMRDAAVNLSKGNVDVDIKHFYNDEIGDLSDELSRMAENIRKQSMIAKEFSEGNLDLEVVPASESDLLGNAIATMVSEENRVMSGIREAVMEIKTGSQQVAAASQSLAQGSTQQASAIQEITASINDITERTKVNANDATTANGLVSKAKDDAREGNGKMHEMIHAMSDINTSSENISKIIKVIDDIAFQTNILALNAAVEAARAGQHGRGFAVVAEEVRNLAGKSAQAASETAELIEDSIEKVTKGSKLAEETAAALECIVEAIEKIVTITNSIAIASNDQATAIAQIDQAINQVSQVVQTNSATSEQCAAASEELSAQAGKLREMIGRYKLKQTGRGFKDDDYQPSAINVNHIELPDDCSPSLRRPDDDCDDVRRNDDVPPVISLDDGFGKY